MAELTSLRLDKWLWAARFYKTRSLAAEAVAGGKVHLNGQRAKPGKDIKVGSQLTIKKGNYSWDITIVSLNRQRGPAKEAVLLYQEAPESLNQRQEQIAQDKVIRQSLPNITRPHRPSKKQRRQIHRFKNVND
ncbi:MAG: S4 domain-containing protein [Methylococcaceae bacterium]